MFSDHEAILAQSWEAELSVEIGGVSNDEFSLTAPSVVFFETAGSSKITGFEFPVALAVAHAQSQYLLL